ncbi:MAG: hypothetical protein HY318_18195, partial [Armatimonadetes bacterium]|nr:hypothetical protein [Armatimonadota bacterium]
MRVLWVSQKGALGDLALQCAAALRRAGPRGSRQPGASQYGHEALLWQLDPSVRRVHDPGSVGATPPTTGRDHSQRSNLVESSGWTDPRLREAINQKLPDMMVLLAEPPSLWEVDALIGRLSLPGLVYLGSPGALRDSSVFRDLHFVESPDASVRTAVPSEFLRRSLSALKT